MKILIIEDEEVAARNLKRLLIEAQPNIEVVDILPSIAESVAWFLSPKPIDLIFLDIQLSDGNCFDIFRQVHIETPIIFTTAFDEYALKAFELNSVDYLLKPIHPKKLAKAIEKFENRFQLGSSTMNYSELIAQYTQANTYKTRFLVKSGQQLVSIEIGQIAYFQRDEIVLLVTHDNHRYAVNFTLDELETHVNPDDFFRINRQFLVHRMALKNIFSYFNSKLKVDLKPAFKDDIVVSQEKASTLKMWLGA